MGLSRSPGRSSRLPMDIPRQAISDWNFDDRVSGSLGGWLSDCIEQRFLFPWRSEEHTTAHQSLMRTTYDVYRLLNVCSPSFLTRISSVVGNGRAVLRLVVVSTLWPQPCRRRAEA